MPDSYCLLHAILSTGEEGAPRGGDGPGHQVPASDLSELESLLAVFIEQLQARLSAS
jgi:hypothetical protein